jgi:hypothetical protein
MQSGSTGNVISAVIFSLIVASGCWPQLALATDDEDKKPSVVQKMKEHISADLRILTYGVIQEPAKFSQNPDNNFLQTPHYTADLELRPDFKLDWDFLELAAKPRAKLEFRIWEEGLRSGETQWKDDWYVNEWLVRLKARENLFISYGRENLQWGPSFLFSPSNPFFRDNGRRNPYMEVQGMDFGRLVWIPHSSWTMSAIVNTDEGRNMLLGPDPFEKTYTLKIDYSGRENYASILISQKDYNKTLGFFGGWTVSDALMLYGEGSVAKGSNALYAQNDASPLGATMQKIHQDDPDLKPILLAGSSYTLEGSGTLTLEYAYNAPGYNSDEAERFYALRRNGANAFSMGGMAGALGLMTLGQTFNPGLRFLRKNYAMLQYSQSNIKNVLDLTLRWTQNLDDGSGQFLSLLSYSLGNHLELFSSGMISSGGENTEFVSTLKYQLMFGLKYTL